MRYTLAGINRLFLIYLHTVMSLISIFEVSGIAVIAPKILTESECNLTGDIYSK